MKRRIAAIVGLIVFWWLMSALSGKPFLPSPDVVFIALYEQILHGRLLFHVGVSLARVWAALFAAFIPALILGIAAARRQKLDSIISPVVYILFPIPKIALLPVILLFLGLGNASKIFLVSLIVFFQYYLGVRDGVKNINRKYYDSMLSLGAGPKEILTRLILPAVYPRLFSTLRLTLGTSIAVLFLAETFATRSGIGWYIMDAWSRISYVQMFAGIAALSIAGALLFDLIEFAERRLCPWTRV